MLRYDTSLLDRSQNFGRAGALGQSIGSTIGTIAGAVQQKRKGDLQKNIFQGYDPHKDTSGQDYSKRMKSYYSELSQRPEWSQEGHAGLQEIQKQEEIAKQQKIKDEFNKLSLDSKRIDSRLEMLKFEKIKNAELDKTLMYMAESPEKYQAGLMDLQKNFPQDLESMGLPKELNKEAQAKIMMRKGVSDRIQAINAAKAKELEAQKDKAWKRAQEAQTFGIKEREMKIKEGKYNLDVKKHGLDVKKHDLNWIKEQRESKATEGISVKDQFDRSKKLRDEYMKHTDIYRDVTNALHRVKASAEMESAPGDLSLVIAYMKMLDPGSVVREGEQVMVRRTGSIPDVVWNGYLKASKGHIINPSLRRQFVEAAENIYSKETKEFNLMTDRYSDLATKYQLDPVDVVGERRKQVTKAPKTETSNLDPMGIF